MLRNKSNPRSSKWLLLLLGFFLAGAAQAAESWTLSAAEWSRPRSGAAVLAMAPVAGAVRAWQAADAESGGSSRLRLLYAGGEEGSLWAAELHDWLIALGVPPGAIELAAGGTPGELELQVLD